MGSEGTRMCSNSLLSIKDGEVVKEAECWHCGKRTLWKLCKNASYYAKCFGCGARAFTHDSELRECHHSEYKREGRGKNKRFRFRMCSLCGDKVFIPVPVAKLEHERDLESYKQELEGYREELEKREGELRRREGELKKREGELKLKEKVARSLGLMR